MKSQIDKIQRELMKQVEHRPYDAQGKRDGNYNFIHRQDIADAFEKIRRLIGGD